MIHVTTTRCRPEPAASSCRRCLVLFFLGVLCAVGLALQSFDSSSAFTVALNLMLGNVDADDVLFLVMNHSANLW
jgi:hypothetical protein